MDWRSWFRPPRHLLLLFLGITVVSASALGWLSWQLVQQDRALASQRAQDQRDNAAGLAIAALQKDLSGIEERLVSLLGLADADLTREAAAYAETLSNGAVLVVFRPNGAEAFPANALTYYPELPTPLSEIGALRHVDDIEYREKNYAKAITALKVLSTSSDIGTRGEALVRLAKNLRQSGRLQEALVEYGKLAQLGDATVFGIPAALLARAAICDVLEAQGEHDSLAHEASLLAEDLRSGRWHITSRVYDVYWKQAQRLLGSVEPPPANALALSESSLLLWNAWKDGEILKPRQTRWANGQPVLVLSRSSPERLVAVIAGDLSLAAWLSRLEDLTHDYGTSFVLEDADGREVVGRLDAARDGHSIRLSSQTGLPWTLYAISGNTAGSAGTFTLRSRLVIAGVLAIALLVVGGSYLIARAVARELAVARLQSDFVSAVSHEFRTPLTVLRQLSELLAKGRVPSDAMRQKYYDVLEQETGRLHRLIEGLLKFGRIEAGALRFQFETMDAASFLQSLVEEFGREADRHNATIELHTNGAPLILRADREALGCAVWNLLDNAIKYSPEHPTVWVDLAEASGRAAISVRDHGVGIAHEDRQRIFQKFVRGDVTKTLGVQGTGIGLAVTRQIVSDHGGEIRLESDPGKGSTFTILLPLATPQSVA
jgi:signal transduction histidine kinase